MIRHSKYGIIYADPPYLYDNPQGDNPKRGGKRYPQMELCDIKSLPVSGLADMDCSLFLWVPMPKLPEGLEIIDAWGFTYTTCAFTWVKLNPLGEGIYSGLGYWTNGNAELCLFGKKGHPKRLAKNIKQIIMAPRSRHSQKPNEARDRIVQLIGDLPRIELFAREEVEGWDCIGNDIDGVDICEALNQRTLCIDCHKTTSTYGKNCWGNEVE